MHSVKVIHTGDMHLGSPMLNMGARCRERSAELNETFSNIINLVKTESADILLIAGDLFDSSEPDAELMDFVAHRLAEIADTSVFIALGNHDFGLKMNFPPNVYVFGNSLEKVSLKDSDIYGVSFGSEHCPNQIAAGFAAEDSEKINIMLMHGDVAAKSNYNPISLADIENSGMDYIALGHIHMHDGFLRFGNSVYSYCGVPEGRAFDEIGPKGVLVVEVSKREVKGKFLPICGRQYLKTEFDISKFEDNFEIAEGISSVLGGKENAYRIVLRGRRSIFLDLEFIKDFLEKDFYFTELIDETEECADDGYTLKNIFMQKCSNENALRYGLKALRGEKVHID